MSAEQNIKIEEQIPLTDAVAVPIVVEGDAAAVAPEEPKPKKNWFTWGKKKGSAVINETNVEEAAVEDEPKKEKEESWWRACMKTQQITIDRDQRMGIDFVNRDRNNLVNNLDFHFENVYGENSSQHSWEWIYRINHYVFSAAVTVFYQLFTWMVLPFTFVAGILFALVATIYTWIVMPVGKLLIIPGNIVAAVWSWLVHAILDPIAAAIGLIFSNFNIRKYGINQENTAPCV